jgi:hypothetical protein
MKHAPKLATLLLAVGALAGCDGIGDGSTIARIDLSVSGILDFEQGVMLDVDTANERYHMYDCFCANLAAIATFTDGSLANFSNRVTFTSDNPAVAEVLNADNLVTELCPFTQQASGLVIPSGIGDATITASFGPLSSTLRLEVADTSAGTFTLRSAPPADPNNTDVAIGAELPLRVTGTLDGRSRTLNRNVTAWSFDDDANGDFASIDEIGVVRGAAPTGALPKTVRAAFGTCSDVSPTVLVNVGDLPGPLTLEREAPDFAADSLLAVGSDEELVAKAPLDFDGDAVADGEQLISSQIALTFTDSCTLREFDASVPGTNCRETATTCAPTVPICTTGPLQLCPSTMTACRTAAAPVVVGAFANQIIAFNDNGAPTNFSATFPAVLGGATLLAAAIDAVATTIEVEALEGYPTTFPWFAVIDAAGTREDVRVTAADGTTLTVVRGVGGTVTAAHAAGASFEQRSYASGAPLAITGKEGTLTTLVVDPPGTLDPLGTLQLRAEGTYVDQAAASRQQRVTRLIAASDDTPTVVWTTSDATVATVGANSGLVFSSSACGGRPSVRARADSSADATTETFDPATTADDDACVGTDPLCDQVELCVATQDPLPLGVSCSTTTTCP